VNKKWSNGNLLRLVFRFGVRAVGTSSRSSAFNPDERELVPTAREHDPKNPELTFLTITWGAHVLETGMPEDKKKLARIPLPPREEEPAQDYATIPELGASANTSERLMAQVPPTRRDPWIVPLASLVLAFSVISLIVECLVAFS
jgi:hypothetical protein